jgi:hypothetical protein
VTDTSNPAWHEMMAELHLPEADIAEEYDPAHRITMRARCHHSPPNPECPACNAEEDAAIAAAEADEVRPVPNEPEDLSQVPGHQLAAEAEAIVRDLEAGWQPPGTGPVVVHGPKADKDHIIDEARDRAGNRGVLFIPDEMTAAVTRDHKPLVRQEIADPNRVEDLPEPWRPPPRSLEQLASKLANVRGEQAVLAEREAELVEQIAAAMRGRLEHPGPWRLDRGWTAPRCKWQSEAVLSEGVKQAADPETGEIDAGKLLTFVRDCVPLTASLGWRMGGPRSKGRGLRDYGIDPDEYSEKGEGHWTVEVTYDPEGPGS